MKVFCTLLLIIVATAGYGQTLRQFRMSAGNNGLVITDSKIDDDGNVVQAGHTADAVYILKMDKKGNMLWVKSFTGTNSSANIRFARNGDYLYTRTENNILLSRYKKDGTQVFSHTVGYSNSYNLSIAATTELPNGNLVICGSNGFADIHPTANSYSMWAVCYDSAMTQVKWHNAYSDSISDNSTLFPNDICAIGDKIYIGGYYMNAFSVSRPILITLDTAGNLRRADYFGQPAFIGADTLMPTNITSLQTLSGKLLVNMFLASPTPQFTNAALHREAQYVARYDTGAHSFRGQLISVRPYSFLNSPRCWFTDTAEVIVAQSPTPEYAYLPQLVFPNSIFLSKIAGSSVLYTKQLTSDTTKIVTAVSADHDTVVLAGVTDIKRSGYYAAYFPGATIAPGTSCKFADSSIGMQPLTLNAGTRFPMNVTARYFSTNYTGMYYTDSALATDFCPRLITGVTAIEPSGALEIFPNPASGSFCIEHAAPVQRISCRDMTGRLISTHLVYKNSHQIQVELAGAASGVYFVEIETADRKISIRKLIMN